MHDFVSILIAALSGFFSGLICSIPVGPVNLTIINEGPRRGFYCSVLIGLGASLMETIYCSIAFTGLASFFVHGLVKTVMEISSSLFLIILGLKFLVAKAVPGPCPVEERIEKTVRPHPAFLKGFLRVLGNPGVLLLWIFASANLISWSFVEPRLEDKIACILGVAAGTSLWFIGLSYAVAKNGQKFSTRTLLLLERGSGIALLVFGVVQGCKIVAELTHAHLKV